ncbi:MAG: NAD(+)/NADH kinase [Desulfobacterales bacterium]|nr:MAG: NAD(+)/NADH kinase [Desulfobacterales bacterium]
MKKIGLVVKADAKANEKADELERWLQSRGVEVVRKKTVAPGLKNSRKTQRSAPSDLFCVFVLGGDGTFLSAVRWIGNSNIPVLGIKFGEVGFMAEVAEETLFAAAEKILAGKFALKPRMRLDVQVNREGETVARETVLNDVVINKGALARLAHIDTYIDGNYLTTYSADGLIIATPTGSTAYSLAAGGPVIHPEVPGIIMTPICPHTLTNRPLILPEDVSVKIKLEEGSSDMMLTFDGQVGLDINGRDEILVKKGRQPINIMRIPGFQYFDILKAKLRWSGGRS